MKWHQKIFKDLQVENYAAVIEFYEELIEREPETMTNYWLLGLAYLLEGREEEANATWVSLLSETEGLDELSDILEEEATRQKEQNNLPLSLVIREYIREIEPDSINNQLEIILLKIKLDRLEIGDITQLLPFIKGDFNLRLLLEVITKVLEYPSLETVKLVKTSLPFIREPQSFLENIKHLLFKIAYRMGQFTYAAQLTELFLELEPNNKSFLNSLFGYYSSVQDYKKADETIDRLLKISAEIDTQLHGEYLRLGLIMKQGEWFKVDSIVKRYKEFINKIEPLSSNSIDPVYKQQLPRLTELLFYIEDNPREIRPLQNKLSRIFQDDLKSTFITSKYLQGTKLKIGYIGSNFRRHSVGWLARWLFKYHDQEKFEVNLYLVNQQEDDLTQSWFYKNGHSINNVGNDPLIIAQKIKDDQIDILIDLDSMTNVPAYWVLALKPAPIQVTWLGLDATGIPNVDYFIVDPYVLPENAQEYYQEKLWRLPQTYLAIDGFEVVTPTLTREELNIPPEAIIYLTAQAGMKRHPETIKMQLKVLKQVPNSYLLIKGVANANTVKELFLRLAKDEDIEVERLRFLPLSPTEEMHRANLTIADVVLDTYPYNGATTTLEVLWMAIPIVTLVGEQFAARNSYTFMINAGVSEGIAFTREEYIEWGVKLGLNEELRSSIHWKLLKNRQTAPLWNAKEFTLEMEKAYYEMASRNL